MKSLGPGRSRARAGLALASALALLVAFGFLLRQPEEAAACGGFFSKRDTGRKPSLSYEQVLIVYDAATSTEHFIREVTFNEASKSFGFVVPTPSRPEVAKVDAPPFDRLSDDFHFDASRGAGTGTGQGFGGVVIVLNKVKVGSFTAFVLAADDEKSLSKWLADNGLASTPEADEWLAHYVRLKFFFVAMRYDPPTPKPASSGAPAKLTKSVKAETIRISFSTPAPFFPYLEPKPKADLPSANRLLELYLVASEPMRPVALSEQGGKPAWVTPLQPGLMYPEASWRLEAALGKDLAKLVPAGAVTVQTFQDQKFSRVGFGDILFVPREKRALDPARKTALLPLLGLLDPTLVPARPEAAK